MSTHATGVPSIPIKFEPGVLLPVYASSSAAMPWTSSDYPVSMKRLHPTVRAKAIEIANAWLEEGYPDGQAFRIAIARAKRWTERHAVHGERPNRSD